MRRSCQSLLQSNHEIKKTNCAGSNDNKKKDLLERVRFNRSLLATHEVFATGTTGSLIEEELGIPVVKFQSGPLGGDQQIGPKIAEGMIDFLIFFWDPLERHPNVKALLRIGVVWNTPVACNRASADFMISSPLVSVEYDRQLPDCHGYHERLERTAVL